MKNINITILFLIVIQIGCNQTKKPEIESSEDKIYDVLNVILDDVLVNRDSSDVLIYYKFSHNEIDDVLNSFFSEEEFFSSHFSEYSTEELEFEINNIFKQHEKYKTQNKEIIAERILNESMNLTKSNKSKKKHIIKLSQPLISKDGKFFIGSFFIDRSNSGEVFLCKYNNNGDIIIIAFAEIPSDNLSL